MIVDGGGIRGYWSLLVLNKLIECIADQEEKLEATSRHTETPLYWHSFQPELLPPFISLELSPEERLALGRADSDDEKKAKAYNVTKRFLPCHYFDYIGGSSTGGSVVISTYSIGGNAANSGQQVDRDHARQITYDRSRLLE
jgi:hypothetical protein